jgi:hypothetical protein
VGFKVGLQPEFWLTVNGIPPAVITPLRGGPELGATSKLTAPDPLPLPDVIEIHCSTVLADHAQPV